MHLCNWEKIEFVKFFSNNILKKTFVAAAQFTFNRERDVNLSSYMEEGIPEEEDESDPEPLSDSGRDNLKLDDVEQGKLCNSF